jgi:pimeloyl-ACP methyl ester carboxylesterase
MREARNTSSHYISPRAHARSISLLHTGIPHRHPISFASLLLFVDLVDKVWPTMKVLLFAFVPLAHGFFTSPPTTIPKSCKILILPGFGNDSIDYTDNGQAGVEGSLVASLRKRGWGGDQIDILPVERLDWLQVFLRGATDLKFWQSEAPPTRPAFRWYLERIADKVQQLEDDEQLILVGHSAGGWLARAAVGFGMLPEAPQIDLDKIVGIVTLGAPNLPPPPEVMDMTRGALR